MGWENILKKEWDSPIQNIKMFDYIENWIKENAEIMDNLNEDEEKTWKFIQQSIERGRKRPDKAGLIRQSILVEGRRLKNSPFHGDD